MQVTEVRIPLDESGDIPGVLAMPEGEGPWPGVVMVHEAFGIEENMYIQIRRMCAAGYLVVMPDLFSRGGARKCLTATFRALSSGQGQAFVDVEAAKNMLLSRSDCTGKIGVIGFCMGGGFALQLANRGYDVSSVNYGMLPKDIEAVLAGACPVVGTFGGKDLTLKKAAATLEEGLTRHGIPHDVKEYPRANHAFMDVVPAGPKLMQPFMQKVVGFRPYPEETEDAWARIEAFFAEYLR